MQTMGSDFMSRRVGPEVGGTTGKTAALDPGSGSHRHVPRSVTRYEASHTLGWLCKDPTDCRPACVVISVHLSHPAPRWLAALNVGCSHGGALFSWALLFLLEEVQKNLKADCLA